MPRLQVASLKSMRSNPAGPGVLLGNVVDFTPTGIANILAGDESKGFRLGALTTAPSVSISREMTDRSEGIVGLNAPFLGAQQVQRTDITIDSELVELTHANLKYIHPGLQEADWTNSAHGALTVGTGNSAFRVTSRTQGIGGNSTTIQVSTPAGATTTVSVTGTAITVAPATTATASQVVAAINAYAPAKALVQAGLPATSDGTGLVVLAASTPLTGGAAGTKIGVRLKPTGFLKDSDYLDNIVIALEGDNTNLLQVWRMNNAIQTDDIDYEPDDEGGISGISVSFAGHVGDADFDPATGVYLPPYEIFNLNTPTS